MASRRWARRRPGRRGGGFDALRQRDGRLRLLRDRAQLDHPDRCQGARGLPESVGPELLLAGHLLGRPLLRGCGRALVPSLAEATGIPITDLAALRRAMEALFARHALLAIAVKSQHAYRRTLAWHRRGDDLAPRRGRYVTSSPTSPRTRRTPRTPYCLGDWCLARGVELASEHRLPSSFIPASTPGTGVCHPRRPFAYRADSRGPVEPAAAALPGGALRADAHRLPLQPRIARARQAFPRIGYADLCWTWAIDPYTGVDFVRQLVHTAPINKLFAFSGVILSHRRAPSPMRSRCGAGSRALEGEVNDGLLTERQAIEVATRVLRGNQLQCFDVAGTQAAIRRVVDDPAALAHWPSATVCLAPSRHPELRQSVPCHTLRHRILHRRDAS